MSAIQKTLERKMLATLQETVELLHDSPLPPLDDVMADLAIIKSFVRDIKSEVRHIEGMMSNPVGCEKSQEAQDKEQGGESRPGPVQRHMRDKLADRLEEVWKPRATGEWEGSAMDDLIVRLRGDDPIKPLDLLTIMTLEYFNWKWPSKVELGETDLPLIKASVQPHGYLHRVIQEYNDTVRETAEVITTEMSSKIEQARDDVLEVIGEEAGNLSAAIAQLHEASNTWNEAIYDKIVECCVREQVEDVLTTLRDQSDSLETILSYLRSGGSPVALGQMGAIMAGIKSMQAELSAIRGLL